MFIRMTLGAMLVRPRVERKRSRALKILLLPAFMFIGTIGWCLYVIGDRKTAKPKTTYRKQVKRDNVTLLPITLDEQQEITVQNKSLES